MALELSDTLLELIGIGSAEAGENNKGKNTGISFQSQAGLIQLEKEEKGTQPKPEPPGWSSSGQWNFTGADAKYQARAAARLHVNQNLDKFKLGRPDPSDPKWNTKFEQTVSDLAKQYMEKARETK